MFSYSYLLDPPYSPFPTPYSLLPIPYSLRLGRRDEGMGYGDNYSLDVIKSFILYLFHYLIIIYFQVLQRIRIYNGPESTKELNLQWSQIYDGLESTAGCASARRKTYKGKSQCRELRKGSVGYCVRVVFGLGLK